MTLIVSKYNYQAMSRSSENGKRLYCCPDGSKLPSVTTILDVTKPLEKKQALQKWRQSIGEDKAQQIVTEAANRGTRMHKFLEDYLEYGELQLAGTNPYSKISQLMAAEVIKNGLLNVDEFWGSEVALYYEGLYAGTTDCTGVWKGKPAILDFKQTNKPKKEEWIEDYYLQLVFYGTAHNKMFNTNIKTGVILMCSQPKTNDKLEIIENPQYQEFVLTEDKWSYYEDKMWDRVEKFYIENR